MKLGPGAGFRPFRLPSPKSARRLTKNRLKRTQNGSAARQVRIQLHKHGDSAAAFTKNGHDHSNRVRGMVDALARLAGVRSLVIDVPNFYRLQLRRLHHKGCDLRELPLFKRKASLEKLIIAANANWQIHRAFFQRGPASPAVDIRQQCRQEAC